MNKIILMGRLTAAPELKTTQSGTEVVSFTLAVNRAYIPKGQQKQTDFIPCVAWRKTAEFICKYFSKGDMLALEGKLQSRKYEDKQGNQRTAYEVALDHAYFCGGKSSKSQQNDLPPDSWADYEEAKDLNDDSLRSSEWDGLLPF